MSPPLTRAVQAGLLVFGNAWLSTSALAQVSATPPTESVVITATRTERSITEVPQSVAVLGNDQVVSTPAFALDDVLRTVPSVNLR